MPRLPGRDRIKAATEAASTQQSVSNQFSEHSGVEKAVEEAVKWMFESQRQAPWGSAGDAERDRCRQWARSLLAAIQPFLAQPEGDGVLERVRDELGARERRSADNGQVGLAAGFQQAIEVLDEQRDTRPRVEQRSDEETRRVVIHVEPERVEEVLDAVAPIVAKEPQAHLSAVPASPQPENSGGVEGRTDLSDTSADFHIEGDPEFKRRFAQEKRLEEDRPVQGDLDAEEADEQQFVAGDRDWHEVWVCRDPIAGKLHSTLGSSQLTSIPPVEALRPQRLMGAYERSQGKVAAVKAEVGKELRAALSVGDAGMPIIEFCNRLNRILDSSQPQQQPKFFCGKCGTFSPTSEHDGCDYLAARVVDEDQQHGEVEGDARD